MYWELKAEQDRKGMVEAAFIGWQMGHSKKSFDDYLKGFGLVKKKSREFQKQTKEKDLEKYRRIVQRVKEAQKQ